MLHLDDTTLPSTEAPKSFISKVGVVSAVSVLHTNVFFQKKILVRVSHTLLVCIIMNFQIKTDWFDRRYHLAFNLPS